MRPRAVSSDPPWRQVSWCGGWRAGRGGVLRLTQRPQMTRSTRFEIFRDEAGAFRWRLLEDAVELAVGLEAFFNDWNAHRSARAFKLGASDAAYPCSESAGSWVWEARGPDGRRLATCAECLPDRRTAQEAADRARRAAPGATGP